MDYKPKLFEIAREAMPITTAVALLRLNMKRSGRALRSSCPMCGGSPRMLVVTPSKNVWYCFKARKGGDAAGLVAHVTGIRRYDAALWLLGQV